MRLSIVHATILGIVTVGAAVLAVSNVAALAQEIEDSVTYCLPSIGDATLTVWITKIKGFKFQGVTSDYQTTLTCSAGTSDRCYFGWTEELWFFNGTIFINSGMNAQSGYQTGSCNQSRLFDTGVVNWGWEPLNDYLMIGTFNYDGLTTETIVPFTVRFYPI